MNIIRIKNQNGQWVDVPAIVGPQGPQGPKGDKGDPGESGVTDVRVNGTSILQNGVANVPIANQNDFGVIKSGSGSFGVAINGNGVIYVNASGDNDIKNGSDAYKPITPQRQQKSVFFGLAKAAGDTTQSQSNNAVGAYTDEAKAAIQTMLDVPSNDDIPEVPVQDVQINGTSILQDGVANVPMASNVSPGVVKVSDNLGVYKNSEGFLTIGGATSNVIKYGTTNLYPIAPGKQHESTFYGLAKAAGDTTQSQSANAVGTYTNDAKTAIQTMLDVPAKSDVTSLGSRVTVLESAPSSGGLTPAIKAALLRLAESVAYASNDGPDCYQYLYEALGGTATAVTLSSISAVLDLNNHFVVEGDDLDTLRPYLTVTATYSDNSQREINNYILSGLLEVGANTITITYEDETDTVTVTANSSFVLPTGYTSVPYLYSSGSANVYLDTGVMSGDFDYAEYNITPTAIAYLKGGDILCAQNCWFPYLTGDNGNGAQNRLGFKNFGNQESAVTSGSYVYGWNLNDNHTIKGYVNGKVYVDDVELFTVPAGNAASAQVRIFSNPEYTSNDKRYFTGRFYWLKLYKNGIIYRNYVPCKNSNDVPGLYETTQGTFIYDTSNSNVISAGTT